PWAVSGLDALEAGRRVTDVACSIGMKDPPLEPAHVAALDCQRLQVPTEALVLLARGRGRPDRGLRAPERQWFGPQPPGPRRETARLLRSLRRQRERPPGPQYRTSQGGWHAVSHLVRAFREGREVGRNERGRESFHHGVATAQGLGEIAARLVVEDRAVALRL